MSQMQTDQREQEQMIGVLTSVVVKGPDKWQAVVQPDGSQYTKNLWTKDQNLVATLMSQIGNRLAFLCNVSHWTNAQQQPVRSLWIEQVGSPAGAPPQPPMVQQQPQQVIVQPQVQPMGTMLPPQAVVPEQHLPAMQPHPDQREAKIHRQTASKVAAIMLGYLEPGERNMSNLLVLSERLVAYYDNGLPKTLEQELAERGLLQPSVGQIVQPQSIDAQYDSAAAQGQGYTNVPDDDIPF